MKTVDRGAAPRHDALRYDGLRRDVMRRDLFKLGKANAKPGDERVRRSSNLRESRVQTIARLNLEVPAELPIAQYAQEIVDLIKSHPVVIVAGETGSGKTTQLPKLCLRAGLGAGATIGHTQPRRIAARTVSQRIAQEIGSELGDAVGFAVRFSDQVGDQTVVKIMTDGLLLAQVRGDRFLDDYDAIIIDEAHERSLNIDFLMGYLKRLSARRRDLKIIITSATIDVARFAEYFDGAPVVTVGGRGYPVETRYQEEPEDVLPAIIDVLEDIARQPLDYARDVLAFFSGEREIFEAAKILRRHFGQRYEVLPLYARLSFAEQRKVFSTTGSVRRVVLATNVAETSLTVPNIGYVIDPGFARINRYSYRSKLQRLPIEAISQASADQRQGRCGRIASGICYRLYSETDYAGRDAYTDPEIRRVNLASVVLQMHAFGLGDIAKFPFIDPPDPRAVKDALRLLDELQAIKGNKLTTIGKQMARLPVDPRLARMLIEGASQSCLHELLIIASGLAIQDPRERPIEKAQAADSAHADFRHEKSDFLSFFKLWNWIEEQRQSLTRSRWQTTLRKRFLNVQRVREWRETHRQLKLVCRELGLRENTQEADYRTIHECILVGSLSLIAQHGERGQYVGARNLKLRIFPGSGLGGKQPKWFAAAEIVETSRVFARCVADIDARWIERKAEHLVKRNHSEPHWSLKRGEVTAYETVTLYGLHLVERRAVSYAKIDPNLSHDLFLREALVHGAITDPPDFLKSNLVEVAQVRDLESKGRRRDLLVSDDAIYQFYEQRIPQPICRVTDLKHWLGGCSPKEHAGLFLTQTDLNQRGDVALSEEDFPNSMAVNGVDLAIKYRFAPGDVDDGISVFIPSGVLHAIGNEPLEWSVPGMLPAVIEHWLRTLPKSKRRALVPIPDKVSELTNSLTREGQYRHGRFLTALSQQLANLYKTEVSANDWDRERLPDHLLLNVKVIDQHAKLISQGRDLAVLKKRLSGGALADQQRTKLERKGLTEFPELQVPVQSLVNDGATPTMTYRGFVDRDNCVDLRAFTDKRERDVATRRGYTRLGILHLGKAAKYFIKELKKDKQLGLYFVSLGTAEQLYDEVLRNVIWYCYFESQDLPTTRDEFVERMDARRGALADTFTTTVSAFSSVLELRFSIVRLTDELSSPAYEPSVADVRRILEWLVPAELLAHTPFAYLELLPHYLEAIRIRLQELPGRVPKDRLHMQEIEPLEQRLLRLREAELFSIDRFMQLKFLIEELRVKLFAENKLKHKIHNHPLAGAFGEKSLKISGKRVAAALRDEELRVGLA
jgi:ATP-dependent helicase HrpA